MRQKLNLILRASHNKMMLPRSFSVRDGSPIQQKLKGALQQLTPFYYLNELLPLVSCIFISSVEAFKVSQSNPDDIVTIVMSINTNCRCLHHSKQNKLLCEKVQCVGFLAFILTACLPLPLPLPARPQQDYKRLILR